MRDEGTPGKPHPNVGPRTAEQWFNTSCFGLPAPFTFGSAPRNSVLAPGYADVDVGLQKEVAPSRRLRFQFRWEIFNVLNHVNFDVPNCTRKGSRLGPGRESRPHHPS
jgi:hypothetical protein